MVSLSGVGGETSIGAEGTLALLADPMMSGVCAGGVCIASNFNLFVN